MTPDEYWNADPELARAYYEAELFRVRRNLFEPTSPRFKESKFFTAFSQND